MKGLPLLLCGCHVLSGCVAARRTPLPMTSKLSAPVVTLPTQMYDNILVIEAKWDRAGPYHFLIDTGSTVTLVTPELAQRYPAKDAPGADAAPVPVRSADGSTTALRPTVLARLDLGAAHFTEVPALIYDCSPLSEQLGVRLDGVLGLPLFRQLLLTLDYPGHRLLLRPITAAATLPGTAIRTNPTDRTPLIPVRLGDRTLTVLVDSGSNDGLSLNPYGLDPKFAFGPAEGPTVGTLTGDRSEQIGRLADNLYLGDYYAVPHPVAALTDELSALGGGLLKYFTVSFDQENARVLFYREAVEPIAIPAPRSAGLSFRKLPAYWRVVGVIPHSPADVAGVEPGDLVTRIDGKPVAQWDSRAIEQLLAHAADIDYTFLNGAHETVKKIKVVELVP